MRGGTGSIIKDKKPSFQDKFAQGCGLHLILGGTLQGGSVPHTFLPYPLCDCALLPQAAPQPTPPPLSATRSRHRQLTTPTPVEADSQASHPSAPTLSLRSRLRRPVPLSTPS
eukprot:1369137-Rhodomonas_salina.1